jgi:hypothetical protein
MVGYDACNLVDGYPTFQMTQLPSSKRESASPFKKFVHTYQTSDGNPTAVEVMSCKMSWNCLVFVKY